MLEQALQVDAGATGIHWRLAEGALAEGRPRDALAEVERQRKLPGPSAPRGILAGRAWRALGDRDRARAEFRDAVRRDSTNAAARDSLAALEREGA